MFPVTGTKLDDSFKYDSGADVTQSKKAIWLKVFWAKFGNLTPPDKI